MTVNTAGPLLVPGEIVAPFCTTTPELPLAAIVPVPAKVPRLLTTRLLWKVAVPPTTVNRAAPLPLPITKFAVLLTTALLTVNVPVFSANWPPALTLKFVAVRLPPLKASVPPLTATLLRALPVPVSVHVPVPTLLNVPAPLTVPAKFVLAPANPTWSVFEVTFTCPAPVNALIVPSVENVIVLLLLTVTATTLVIAPALAQLNTPPATIKFVLANVPLTVNVAPLTKVSPV